MNIIRSLSFSIPLLALLIGGCQKEEKSEQPPPEVKVEKVTYDYITTTSNFIGQAVAYDEVDLVARVEGFLEKRNFEEGSFVKKGDLLFEIEKALYKAKVDAAQAEVDQDSANLKDANREYDRLKGLYEKSASSKKDFDKAETTRDMAAAKELASRANLELAKLNLSYTEIRAPFDGRIGTSVYSAGNLVSPSSGKLANIVRKDLIKVDFYISERIFADYLTARERSAIEENVFPYLILPNGQTYDQKGTLALHDNRVNPNTGTVLVRAVFPNPKNILIPGMYLKIKLEDKQTQKHIYIPVEAIQEDQSGKFVIVVGAGNKAEKRNIKIDLQQNTGSIFAIVSEGLKEGELIVVDGVLKVHEGSPVKPILRETTNGVKLNDSKNLKEESEIENKTDATVAKKANSETKNTSLSNDKEKEVKRNDK